VISNPIPEGRFRPSALFNSVDVALLTELAVGTPLASMPKTVSSSLFPLAKVAEPALMLVVTTYSPSGENRIADGRFGRLRVEPSIGVKSPSLKVKPVIDSINAHH